MSISGSVVALSRGSSGAQGVGEEGRERGRAVVGTKGHNLLVSGYEWLQQIDQEGFPLSISLNENLCDFLKCHPCHFAEKLNWCN